MKKEQKEMTQDQGLVPSTREDGWARVVTERRMAIDPVCKMVMNPAEAPASFIYGDKVYYFCHPNCRESFEKDPENYL